MIRPTLYSLVLSATAVACLWLASLGCAYDSADAEVPGSLNLSINSKAVAAPGDTVDISASVSGTYYQVKSYSWDVTDPNGSSITTKDLDYTGKRVSFKVTDLGTHGIRCRATLEAIGTVLQAEASILVEDPSVAPVSYIARVIPPPSSGFPPTDKKVSVGKADQSQLQWTLSGGQKVKLSVEDSAGSQASYLRLFRTGADPMPRDIYLATGEATVCLSGVFHALVLPDSETLAPFLKTYVDTSTLGSSLKVTIPKAAKVTGNVTLQDKALAGASVVLHSEEKGIKVPSTRAKTTGGGAFALNARPGLCTFSVVPPASTGLPVAVVADTKLQLFGDSGGWTFDYAKAPGAAKVSGKVTRSDGKTPAAGASVLLKLKSTVKVGTLKTPAGTFQATGLVRRVLVADVTGALKDQQSGAGEVLLAQGTYDMEAWPGTKAPAGEGYAKGTLVVSGDKPASFAVKLSPRATLKSKVLDQQSEGVRATITATGTTGTFTTTTNGEGAFSLTLDDKASYSLVIRALGSGSKVSSLIRPSFKVAGGGSLPAFTLPAAVSLSGKVTTTGNLALGGALIRVWCSGASCASNQVLDETHTKADGTFEVRVPKATE